MPIQYNKDGSGVIVINDFTGGINTLGHALFIKDNQTPTATNVWASGGMLTKRPARIWYKLGLHSYRSVGMLFGPEDNMEPTALPSSVLRGYKGMGYATSSGKGGVFDLQTMIVSGREILFANLRSLIASGSSNIVFTTIVGIDSNIVTGWPFWPVATGARSTSPFLITQTANLSYSTILSIGWGKTTISASATTWTSVPLTNTFAYGIPMPKAESTSLSISTREAAGMFPITIVSSATASHPVSYITTAAISTSTSIRNQGLINNLTPGETNLGGPKPTRIVSLNEQFFCPFMSSPAFSLNAGVTGGAIVFTVVSGGTQLQSDISSPGNLWGTDLAGTNGTIVTAWPLTYGEPIVHKNYIFAIASADPTNIRWSALSSGTTWPVNNNLYVGNQTQDAAVKLIVFGDNIVIVKKKSLWTLVGDTFDPANPTYSLAQINTPTDFLVEYPNAITIDTRNGMTILKILTKSGLYSYTGGLNIEKLPEDNVITPILYNLKPVGLNENYCSVFYGDTSVSGDYAAAYSYKDNYILNTPIKSNGRARRTLVKDFRNSWWGWDTILSATGLELNSERFTEFNNELYSSNTIRFDAITTSITYDTTASNTATSNNISTGFGVLQHFTTASSDTIYYGGMFNGTASAMNIAITADWKSKIFDIGYGHFYNVSIYHTKQASGNMEVTWWIDGTNSASASFDMSKGGAVAGGLIKNTVQIGNVGHSIQFKLANNDLNTTFEIFKIESKFKTIQDEEIV